MVDKLKPKTLGLRQRIAQAKTETDIDALNREAGSYKDVSPHTRRRWANTADRRLAQLRHGK